MAIPNNALARLFRKAGWTPETIRAVDAALMYDAPNKVDPNLLARKLWFFIAARQREAALNALAADAIDRQKAIERMQYEREYCNVDDEYQLRLEQLFPPPWPDLTAEQDGSPHPHD